MAGYTRQSTFADGDTITAALFNNEYNQLLNAFGNTSGHKHDGTANEGPVIGLIGDAGETSPNNKVLIDTTNNFIEFYVQVSSSSVQQLYIADGAIIPVTDSDIDLGTTSLRFKDTYTDTITTTGNVAVGGNLTVTGTTTFNGGTITMGDAATDNVVFGADVDSNIIPDDDDSYDLGSSSQEWRNLYIDGTANIDSLIADTADINGGTIDGAIIGGSSAAAITGTAITGTSFVIGSATITEAELEILDGATVTTDELNILDGVTSTAAELNLLDGVTSTTAELNILDGVTASAADINLIDGITNGTVIASKAIITDANKDITGGRNITITGELDAATLDISGNADIDGTLETDALSINGTTVTSTAAELNILDGVTATAAEINALDGITSTVAELNILDGVTSTAAELNLLDGKAFLDEDDMSSNSATGIASQQSIKAYVDTQITAEDLDITTDSGTIAIDLDSETLTVSGGTGLDSSATGNAVTLAIDSTVATLTGSQTLTNKSLTAPTLTGTAVVASLDISGDIDVDGTTNLDVVDIDGAVAMATSLTIGGTSPRSNYALDVRSSGGNGLNIQAGDESADVVLAVGSTSTADKFTITSGGAVTTTGVITANAGVVVDTMTLDAATLTATGDFTIDASADIVLNADGGDIFLSDGAVGFGTLKNSSSHFFIESLVSDKDILIRGNDGGSIITAVEFDMSAAGAATFNSDVGIGATPNTYSGYTTLTLGSSSNGGIIDFERNGTIKGEIFTEAAIFGFQTIQADDDIIFKGNDGGSTITALTLDMSAAGAATFNSSVTTGGEVSIAPSSGTAKLRLTSQGTGSEVFTINGQIPGVANGGFAIRNETDSRNDFFIDAAGAATFAGNVNINGDYLNLTNAFRIRSVSGQTGQIGFNRDPAGGANLGESSLARFQINGPFSGSNFLDFQSYHSNGNYQGGMRLDAGGLVTVPTAGAHAVFNENSVDADFRVESNGNDHMLFVDGGNDKVRVGTSAGSQTDSPFNTRRNGANIEFGHSNNGAGYYGTLGAWGSAGHPYIGLSTDCENSANTFSTRGHKGNLIYSNTSSGDLIFAQLTTASATGQTPTTRMVLDSSGGLTVTPTAGGHVVFNEGSVDADFRVESNGNSHMLFVDGGNNKVKIGTSATLYSGGETMSVQCGSSEGIGMVTSAASKQLLGLYNAADSGTRYYVRFAVSAGGSEVGKITSDGSSTTYATTSDARLKDVTGEARGLEVINKLNPVAYNWKESGKADEGLIAQEVQKIVPNAVVEGEEDEMYCMDYSKLVVHLVAGMKEQQTQIEALQSEINLLKGE